MNMKYRIPQLYNVRSVPEREGPQYVELSTKVKLKMTKSYNTAADSKPSHSS